jgi:hypothetical protein
MTLNFSTDSWSGYSSGSSSSRFDDMVLSISTEIQRFDLIDMTEAKRFISANGINNDEISNIIITDSHQLLMAIIQSGHVHKLRPKHIYLAIENSAPFCFRILTNVANIQLDWDICFEKYKKMEEYERGKKDFKTSTTYPYFKCIMYVHALEQNKTYIASQIGHIMDDFSF